MNFKSTQLKLFFKLNADRHYVCKVIRHKSGHAEERQKKEWISWELID